MARVFLYARVSTSDQTTENQVREADMAVFKVETKRIVKEADSGSVAAIQRPGFARLMDPLEADDILVVTRLDRLGWNAMGVRATIDKLAAMSVRVHCLQFGGTDLTSPAGRMVMGVIGAMAEFERDLLIERTASGLRRAKAEGTVLGRPATLNQAQRRAVQKDLEKGASVSELARRYGTSRQTVMRVRDGAAPA